MQVGLTHEGFSKIFLLIKYGTKMRIFVAVVTSLDVLFENAVHESSLIFFSFYLNKFINVSDSIPIPQGRELQLVF